MQILLLTSCLIMTEERLKRRKLLPFIFIVKCFKKPLLTIKPADHFISCFIFRLTLKYWKSSLRNINYDFLKMPHKEPSQNLSGHAAGWRSVSQKYNMIWSPDQYPCLVLRLVCWEQEEKLWALTFLNHRSSINIAKIQPQKGAWHNFAPLTVPKFPTSIFKFPV